MKVLLSKSCQGLFVTGGKGKTLENTNPAGTQGHFNVEPMLIQHPNNISMLKWGCVCLLGKVKSCYVVC